jgi:exonuclease SbcD
MWLHKFAHMADIHLGSHREPILQKLQLDCFKKAIDKCISEKVDFILICGDLFHVGIPDLGIVREALASMKEANDLGIPIYVIYGSHDYTPTGTTIVDLMDTAGIIKKIVKGKIIEGKLQLNFYVDQKTEAKLVGISARRIGLESKYYEILDREVLENEDGFKIFAFHSALSEIKPESLKQMDSIPISLLPKGFDYYAGGHVHSRSEKTLPGYNKVVFPGPLGIGFGRDLEFTAKGERRGFYIVSFKDKIESIDFIEIKSFEGVYFEYDVTFKNSVQVQKELDERLEEIDVKDRFLVLKVKGELAGGKTSDINFPKIKKAILERGALTVHLNRLGLTSKEFSAVKVMGEDISTIESKLFHENLSKIRITNESIKGEKGTDIAKELLRILRQEQKPSESKKDYEKRINRQAIDVLRLQEAFD